MKAQKQLTVAIGLIRDGSGKILLQKRLDPEIPEAHKKWEFPGGRIDFGESAEETVVRECREEVGCEVAVKRLLPHIGSKVWSRTDGVDWHVIVLCYEMSFISGTPRPSDKKVSEVAWFSREEIRGLDTLPGIVDFVSLLDS